MILVAGATGVLGSEIVRNLLARVGKVRAMTRKTSKPETVDRLRKAGAQIVVADLKDPASLVAACKGVDGVISTVTSVTTAQPGDSFASTDGQGTIAAHRRGKECGAKKFVFISFDAIERLRHLFRAPSAMPRGTSRRVARLHNPSAVSFFESWLGPMLFADPVAAPLEFTEQGLRRSDTSR